MASAQPKNLGSGQLHEDFLFGLKADGTKVDAAAASGIQGLGTSDSETAAGGLPGVLPELGMNQQLSQSDLENLIKELQ